MWSESQEYLHAVNVVLLVYFVLVLFGGPKSTFASSVWVCVVTCPGCVCGSYDYFELCGSQKYLYL
jgi:hypothetical protein